MVQGLRTAKGCRSQRAIEAQMKGLQKVEMLKQRAGRCDLMQLTSSGPVNRAGYTFRQAELPSSTLQLRSKGVFD